MNTTESEKNQEKKEQFNILFKTVLKGYKSDFKSYPISDIPSALPIAYQSYQHGFQNIYLHPTISNPDNPKESLFWLALDIETPGKENHYNIKKNIETCHNILMIFSENGLLTDCHLALTGYGFRLIYPCYIPPELSKAFKEFLLDFSKLGIDSGLNLDKHFIRISGYRGHENQCQKKALPIDRHIHYLDDPSQIPLTEKDYLDLVSGKPDYKSDMAIIPKLLPTKPISDEWKAFLKPFQRKASLSNGIWRGYPIARKGNLTREQLQSVLGDNVRNFVEKESFGLMAKLNKCPVCNRDGSWVTGRGYLKCFHTSCQAGSERDEKGKSVGLPAYEWNQDLADLVSEIEDDETHEPENIVEKRQIEDVRNAIESAYQTDSDYLIKAMPGVGKTTTTLQAIAPRCNDETFLYLTISHKLCNEVSEKAKEFGIENIQVLTGRNEKNCKNYSQISKIAKQGYSIKFTLCLTCSKFREKNEIDTITGELVTYESCGYMKQFEMLKQPGLVIAPYQFANFKKVLDSFSFLGGLEKMTVIIDENPINAFIEDIFIDTDSIRFFRNGSDEPVKSFFDKLQKIQDDTLERLVLDKGRYDTHARLYCGQAPNGSQWDNLPTLFELAEITAAEIDALDRHLDNYRQRIDPKTLRLETMAKWQRRLFKDNINFNAYKWLDNAINQHGTAYLRIDTKRKDAKIRYVTFKKNLPNFTGCQIVNLDATGNKSELDSLFGRDFQVIEGNVEMPNVKKVWIKQNTGKTQIIHLDDKKIENLLKKSIPYLRTTDQKILILTFKDISDRVLEIAGRLLPDKTLDAVHFGAGRGLNKWKDFDAVICLGWLNINKKDSLDLAQMLYSNDQERQDFVIRTGKNEVLQGVHRIRLIFGNKNIIIIARNWLSELGDPDEIVSSQNRPELFEDAVYRCEGFIRRFGCIDRYVMWSLGICTKSDKAIAEKGYQAFKQVRINENLGMFKDETILTFGGNYSVYNKILETLSDKYDLPYCEINIKGKWLKALGNIESFEKVYSKYGKWDEKYYRPAVKPLKKPKKTTKTTTGHTKESMKKKNANDRICKDCKYKGLASCLRLYKETKEFLPLKYKENENCEYYIPKEKPKIYA